jgi:hypothetical protein
MLDATYLLNLLSVIIIALQGWTLREVIRLNGSVRELKQWSVDHERLDTIRFEALTARVDTVPR